MKTLMKLTLFVALLSPSAHADPTAATVPLFTVTNDRDANVDKFGLMVDGNGNPAGVSYAPPGGGATHSFRDIARGDGVVLIEGQGRKVLLLSGQLGANGEGKLELAYLANGLTGKYKTCNFLLRRSGGSWIAQNAYTNRRITAAKIETHRLGLKTLQGICPAEQDD